MSSGLPSMAVAPVDELSNEEWCVNELNSFLLNNGCVSVWKKKELLERYVFRVQWIKVSDYFGLNLFLFSLPSLLFRCREHFSMQNPDAPRTKKGTTSSSVQSSCPTFHAS